MVLLFHLSASVPDRLDTLKPVSLESQYPHHVLYPHHPLLAKVIKVSLS